MSVGTFLERARAKFPALEVEDRGADGIYINFAFSQAVVIELDEADTTMWHAHAYAWDRTHGVSDELWIATSSTFGYLLGAVDTFLREQIEQERKLEELLASRPDD